jgi:hypothetical protein
MWTKSLFLLITVTVGVGCAHKRTETREERREERREQALEARHEPPVDYRRDWSKLGERWVDGTRDHDVIPVGAREGAYRRIMLVVENSALELRDLTVNFADGTHFSPPTKHVFGPNSRSRVIDLPGAQRIIRSVDLRYGNLPGGGRAQAELWAQ